MAARKKAQASAPDKTKSAGKPRAAAKDPNRDEKGRLKKGVVLNPEGKKPGTPNRLTADMKTMIEQAMQRAGENVQKKRRSLKDLEPGIAYLVEQAEKNPVAFMGLAKGLLPAKIDLDVTVMSRDLVTMLQARREQLTKLRDVTPQQDDDAA